ncbi:MAG: phosphate transport system protein [Fusobacteria bacterium]|nr:MAG: phosphate transport system protein [Fusobacteriota bacterium]KAF0230055.1 MAG: phosphate transport system [Fusobacteriota bacterium]
MSRGSFDQALNDVNQEIIELGSRTIQVLEKTKVALTNLDEDLAKQIYDEDDLIDAKEIEISEKCMNIIIREQPIARDLRFLLTALKISSDFERICDHSAQITKLTRKLLKHNAGTLPGGVEEMFNTTLDLVKRIVKAYATSDMDIALGVYEDDDRLDQAYKMMVKWIKSKIENNVDQVDQYIDYLFISKYFERIGDRTNSIAKWIIYKEKGTIRHYYNMKNL